MATCRYIVFNGAVPTTASQVAVATGTSIKTLQQVATPSTTGLIVIEWGITFDGISSTAVPGICELIQTDVAATSGTSVTPTPYGVDQTASLCVGGTGATNFSPSAEGTITATRVFDAVHVPPTGGFVKQFPLGREPFVPVSKFLRVRVKFAATVNAISWIVYEE
jgi:hypothetical protein